MSFYCLTAVAMTFNIKLNRSSESSHPCLISDFKGKGFQHFIVQYVSYGFEMGELILLKCPYDIYKSTYLFIHFK